MPTVRYNRLPFMCNMSDRECALASKIKAHLVPACPLPPLTRLKEKETKHPLDELGAFTIDEPKKPSYMRNLTLVLQEDYRPSPPSYSVKNKTSKINIRRQPLHSKNHLYTLHVRFVPS